VKPDTCWLSDGGWVAIDEATPTEEILEVVQRVFSHIPSQAMLMSLRDGSWPSGVWHWEPEGHPSSTEPTHYRKMASSALGLATSATIPAPT